MGKKKAPQTSDRDVRSRSTTSILSSGGLVEDGVKAKMIGTGGGRMGKRKCCFVFSAWQATSTQKIDPFSTQYAVYRTEEGGGGGGRKELRENSGVAVQSK